jgi:hypothetical protein
MKKLFIIAKSAIMDALLLAFFRSCFYQIARLSNSKI